MTMTYDGALAMPSSYAIMDEEEMTYVEGGISLSTKAVGIGLDVVISLAIGSVTGGFSAYMSKLVSKYGAQKAGLHFGNMATKWAIKYFGAQVGKAAGAIIGVALNVVSVATAPGAAIANYWATHDKNPSTAGTIEI